MGSWNAGLYDRFGQERRQPSIDLAARITKDPGTVLDVGCGSGLSTLSLRERFPDADITGVDLSAEMLERAGELLPDVRWLQMDCSGDMSCLGRYDLVFSNAFLQWLPDQRRFVRDIRACLKPSGLLAMQIPAFDEMPAAELIRETVALFQRDRGLLKDAAPGVSNFSLREYYEMLSEFYGTVQVWQTAYIHQMDSSDAIVDFVKGTALIPYLARLNEAQQADFLTELRRRTAEVYQPCSTGKVLFPFQRMFFIASL